MEWSEQVFRIFGRDPGDRKVTLSDVLAYVHRDDREEVERLVGRMRAEGGNTDHIFRIVRDDGQMLFVRSVGTQVFEDGVVNRYFGTVMDVTEHELLTGELRRREAYLAEAQTLSRTGSFGWRPDSGEIVWSAETYRIFGYDETMKPTLDSLVRRVHPEDRVEFQRVIDAASGRAASHFEHTYRLLLPDGRVKHVHALARRIADAFESHEFVGGSLTSPNTSLPKTRCVRAKRSSASSLTASTLRWPRTHRTATSSSSTSGFSTTLERLSKN